MAETEFAVGDLVQITQGEQAGQTAVVKSADILTIAGLGRRYFLELTSGPNKGKVSACFSIQIKKPD